MAAKGGIRVPVVTTVDTKDLVKMTTALDGMKRKIDKQAKGFDSLGRAIKGAFAFGAVGGLFTKALAEASESYKVSQITNSILKNTGAAAYITSQQIGDLSAALAIKTGIDDELIQSGANVILSFKNIRNVGAGQKAMFDRTTKAAVDLSTVLGTDVASAAKILGKAMADPTKAAKSLRAANILLTDSQKASIAEMQKKGDLLGAQSVIIGEIESRYSGAAEAAATPIEKLQMMLNELLEQVGIPLLNAIMPVFEKLVPHFKDATVKAFKFGEMIVNVFKVMYRFRGVIIAVGGLLVAMWTYSKVAAAAGAIIKIIKTVIGVMKALRTASLGAVIAEAVATGGFSLIAAGIAATAATAAVVGFSLLIDNVTKSTDDMNVSLDKMPDIKSDLGNLADAYSGVGAAIDATTQSAKDWQKVKVPKVTAPKRSRVSVPRTAAKAPRTVSSSGSQSFTVGGSGGGLSLSVTVNGSVIQEKDIARTIRDELIQFGRRVGKPVALGV